jgi:apolipoprotein N-acyltransferase
MLHTLWIRDVRIGDGLGARWRGIGALHRLAKVAGAIGGGMLLSVSFPPLSWWASAIVGMALLAWVLADTSTHVVGGFGYGLIFGLAFYIPLLPWTGVLVGIVPWLALAIVCALFPAVFAIPAVLMRGVTGWPLRWAAWWTAIEWLKSVFPFGGFPWGVVGFSQAEGPLAAFARLGGVALVSFVTALAGFCIAALGLLVRRSARIDLKSRLLVPAGCLALVTAGAAATWPSVRQSTVTAGPAVTVAVVQGNVPRLGLDFNAQRRAVLDNHVRETLRLAEDIRSGRTAQPARGHLAGEFFGYRSASQCGCATTDNTGRQGGGCANSCWCRPGPPRGESVQTGKFQHGDRLGSDRWTWATSRQEDCPAVR